MVTLINIGLLLLFMIAPPDPEVAVLAVKITFVRSGLLPLLFCIPPPWAALLLAKTRLLRIGPLAVLSMPPPLVPPLLRWIVKPSRTVAEEAPLLVTTWFARLAPSRMVFVGSAEARQLKRVSPPANPP